MNGDKLFDDLAARLETLDASDRLSVIVRVEGKLTRAGAAALEQSVGDYELGTWLPIVDGFEAKMTKRQIEALAAKSGVASVELNGVVRAYNDSAQSSFGVGNVRAVRPDLDGNADGNPAYSPADVVVAVSPERQGQDRPPGAHSAE